jgi:hypothetical protein
MSSQPGNRRFRRRRYYETPHSRRVTRDQVDDIVSHLKLVFRSQPIGKKRLIVMRGEAGVGKTWLLEQVGETCQALDWRVLGIFALRDIVAAGEDGLRAVFRQLLQTGASGDDGRESGRGELITLAYRLQTMLGELVAPTIILVDDLERLSYCDRDLASDIRNLLLRPVLESRGPATIVAAARSTRDQPLPFLNNALFQTAQKEVHVPLLSRADIWPIRGPLPEPTAGQIDEQAAGCPLLAQLLSESGVMEELGNEATKQQVLRDLVDELMDGHALKPSTVEVMRLLVHLGNCFQIEDVPGEGGVPAQRVTELIRSSFITYDMERLCHRVYPPLAAMLSRIDPMKVGGSARERLFDALAKKCSLEELTALGQRSGVAPDSFKAQTRASFAQDLFAYFERRDRLADLRFGLFCARPDLEDTLYSEGE